MKTKELTMSERKVVAKVFSTAMDLCFEKYTKKYHGLVPKGDFVPLLSEKELNALNRAYVKI